MSKFKSMLSQGADGIKKQRAETIANSASLEMEDLITRLRRDLNSLKQKEMTLTDIGPDNEYSLHPANQNFDAAKWISQMHKLRMDIRLKEIEMSEAISIKAEWFTDDDSKK